MSDRRGEELARAIEEGDDLTETERLRVVVAMKNQQIDRLAGHIGRAIVAVQTGERAPRILEVLQEDRPTT